MSNSTLRPLERVVVRLDEDGASHHEIGRRIGKRPLTVRRILEMVNLKEGNGSSQGHRLRPVERVVLRLRSEGESYGEIGHRLSRSGRHVQNIERYAQFKLTDTH